MVGLFALLVCNQLHIKFAAASIIGVHLNILILNWN